MKTVQLFTILVIITLQVSAQTTFAPVGAEWYYDMQEFGVRRATVVKDTIIQGIIARKIKHKAMVEEPWSSLGLKVNDNADQFVYNNADTVFIYNTIFNRFTPLYVFNAQPGDTVCLNTLQHETAIGWSDSNFCFVVDSVKMDLYDTSYLKTVYTHYIDKAGSSSWGAIQLFMLKRSGA